MVDENVLARRLAAITDRLSRVDESLSPTVEEFRTNRTAQEVVSFNLFLAFQDALDIAAHVIADRGWELPQTGREHFEILARHGILTSELARELAGCAGLRNLIAHAYGSLDLTRLYEEIPAGLLALRAFGAAISARTDL